MGRLVALDTNALIHEIECLREGRPTALLAHHEIVVPVAVLGEFLCGFENGKQAPADRKLLDDLLELNLCPVEPFDKTDAACWARVRVTYCPKAGRSRDATDLFIAAQVVALGVPLVSDDRGHGRGAALFRQLCNAGEIEWYQLAELAAGGIPDAPPEGE